MATTNGPSVKARVKKINANAHKLRKPSTNDFVNADDDGMDFAEFVQSILSNNSEMNDMNSGEILHEVFNVLDCDRDGFITAKDLKNSLQMFSEGDDVEEDEIDDKELNEMIAEADGDKDGKISFQDFIKVLTADDEKNIRKR